MFSIPLFLSFAITRLATSTSSAVGRRVKLARNNSSRISSSDLPAFTRFATRVFPCAPTRLVTTGEVIIIMACTGLAIFLSTGGSARSAW